MLVKIFKKAQPYLLLILASYAVLLNVNLYFDAQGLNLSPTAPLSQLLSNFINVITFQSHFLLVTLYIALLFLQALLLNQIVYNYKIIDKANGLTALCYILLSSLFSEHIFMSSAFFAAFPIIFAVERMYRSYNNNQFTHLFDIGFSIGLASLLYLPALIFTILMLIILLITRIFNWREWVVSVVAVIIPYFLTATYYLLTDGLGLFLENHFTKAITSVVPLQLDYLEIGVKVGLSSIIAAAGLFFFQNRFLKSIVKTRVFLTILVYLLTISVLTFLLINPFSLGPIIFLNIPLSIFGAYSLYNTQNTKLAELSHFLLFITLFIFQYIY